MCVSDLAPAAPNLLLKATSTHEINELGDSRNQSLDGSRAEHLDPGAVSKTEVDSSMPKWTLS
jgi:hypothetical protein